MQLDARFQTASHVLCKLTQLCNSYIEMESSGLPCFGLSLRWKLHKGRRSVHVPPQCLYVNSKYLQLLQRLESVLVVAVSVH